MIQTLCEASYAFRSLFHLGISDTIKSIYFAVLTLSCNYGGIGGELSIRIFRIQKRVIRLLAGVSSRMSCRQLFKELNILTVASLYIFEVTCFIRKYCQSLEQNTQVHQHNTRRKLDLHVKMQNTEVYKKSNKYGHESI